MQDANKNRLYVHEVFIADKIKKGDTLQTAASKPHGGISLYRDILANVLETVKNTSVSDTKHTTNLPNTKESEEKIDDSTLTEQETPVQAEEQVQSEESPAESLVTEQAETPTPVQPKESKKAKRLRKRAEKWMKETGVTVRLLHSIDEVSCVRCQR